jgi:hypothetical protein
MNAMHALAAPEIAATRRTIAAALVLLAVILAGTTDVVRPALTG